MKRNLLDFLSDIVAYSEKAIDTANKYPPESFHRFSDSGMVIMLCLEIIGEAVKNIPSEVRNQYPNVGWKQAAAMRDILSHQYWRTDFNIILGTVQQDLPTFLKDIRQVISDYQVK